MHQRQRLILFFGVLAVIVALDQGTKALVRTFVGPPQIFAGGLFTLLHTENTGAFLSLGANLPPWAKALIFGVFVAVLLVMFTIAVVRGSIEKRGETIAAAAIIGGGFGNLMDRMARGGRVTDFLYLQAGPLHTGIFNVADMAITFGVIWLLLTMRTKPSS
ncbi:MAG TPA: signal peptidase II [Thermoanaerobaculia bacterium]|nr:signal peptidase II [Thermoanaerobaculia bacterium]